jgi:hypothetical protein
MKKYIFSFSAIALAIFASSFTVKTNAHTVNSNHKLNIQTWYFNGSTTTDVLNHLEYGSSPQFSCDAVNTFPCEIQFDASQYTVPTSNTPLQNYLNAEGSAAQVKADAVSIRSKQ